MDQYKILTVTHNTVQLSELKHYIVSENSQLEKQTHLTALKNHFGFPELMYLSTCNRVTYFFTSKEKIDSDFIARFFLYINPFFPEDKLFNLTDTVLLYNGADAINHLCELAASLDSMVVGEREIIRQLREAYDQSKKMQLTGDDIRLALKFVIPAAKKILTETNIARKPISIVSLAINTLKQEHIDKHARFILIGSGQTNQLIATYLLKLGFTNFTVFSRTFENAEKLAEKINGRSFMLDEIEYYSEGFDVIISCTAATGYVLTHPIYKKLLAGDTSKKILLDLAIPNDIDIEIVSQHHVRYIEIESLRTIAASNLEARKEERNKAKIIVEEFVKEFQLLYRERQIEKAHDVIPLALSDIREKALKEVFAKEIDKLDTTSKELIDEIVDYFEKKYIALAITSAKKAMHVAHKHSKDNS